MNLNAKKSAKDSFENIKRIAKKLKNPCYILEEEKLRENLEILEAVKKQSGAKILLALKGFAFWSSFKMVAKYLDGITASGYYEARLGLEEFRKYNKKAIISVFSPAFSSAEIRKIAPFSNHIIFNSFNQMQKFRALIAKSAKGAKMPHIALRLNPLYSEVEPEIYNPCAKFSRLGITPSAFEAGLKTHSLDGVNGLHFHTHCEQNSDALERTLEAVERHFGKYIAQMEWINFGGGHHITRKDYDINRLVRVISRFRKKYGVEVILEPGEAVGWQCGVLVGEVVDIVRNGVDIAITNLSAATQMPDCLEMPYTPEIVGAKIVGNSSLELHSADSANFECSQTPSLVSSLKTKFPRKFAESYESQTENPSVVDSLHESKDKKTPSLRGDSLELSKQSTKDNAHFYRLGCPSCLAGDIIGDYIFDSPLKIGDKIIIKDMIHYTIVKNNLFNGIPLPSLGILKKNGDFKIVRKFGYNDYKKRNG